MQRIRSFEIMRFVMIITIVMDHLIFLQDDEHFIGQLYNSVLANPYPAVCFFFILSGFGLEYSNKDVNGYPPISFLWTYQKIKRIYPLYLFSILTAIPATLYMAISIHGCYEGIIRTLIKISLVPFMLQSLTGMTGFSHAFNGVCWFLSALFIIYACYPLLHRANIRLKRKGIKIYILVFICSICF